MKPLVSVVIATRDRPEMLREAIASIRDQVDVGPLEIVLVYDQAEPDASLAVSEQSVETRVTSNERKPGLAGARNSGILAARGEFVAFCDDDDYWLPDKLRRQMAALQQSPAAVLATCGISVEYAGQRHDRVLASGEITLGDLTRDRLTELHPSTFLFRRSALLGEVGLVDEEVPGGFGEDYELLLRTVKVAPIRNVSEVGTVVRWGGQSFFFRRWAMMSEGLQYVIRQHPEIATSRRGLARIEGQIAFAEAAQGQRGQAWAHLRSATRSFPLEPRLPLAALVSLGLVSPGRVMSTLHTFGRGI